VDDTAAVLEALQRDDVVAAADLDQDAPGALVDAELGTGMAPAQEVDLPGLLEGQLCVHEHIIGRIAEDLM
jgi:hypothetical protein